MSLRPQEGPQGSRSVSCATLPPRLNLQHKITFFRKKYDFLLPNGYCFNDFCAYQLLLPPSPPPLLPLLHSMAAFFNPSSMVKPKFGGKSLLSIAFIVAGPLHSDAWHKTQGKLPLLNEYPIFFHRIVRRLNQY